MYYKCNVFTPGAACAARGSKPDRPTNFEGRERGAVKPLRRGEMNTPGTPGRQWAQNSTARTRDRLNRYLGRSGAEPANTTTTVQTHF